DMETNNHFGFAGLPTASTASGLKPSSSSGESLYTNGSTMNYSQQGKSLNGDMNVNGISTVSRTSTSGTFPSATEPTSIDHHPDMSYDFLWNYMQYPSMNSGNVKENQAASQFPAHGPYQLNGIVGAVKQTEHIATSRGQEYWENGTQSLMGLNFNSQGLQNSYPNQNFGLVQNGPQNFYMVTQPTDGIDPTVPSFPQSQTLQQQDIQFSEVSLKGLDPAVSENGTETAAGLSSTAMEPALETSRYNGSEAMVEPPEDSLHLGPEDDENCLADPSQLNPPLEESETSGGVNVGSFSTSPAVGVFFGIQESTAESEEEKTSPEKILSLPALDCTDGPSLDTSTSFNIMADDSQNSAPLFVTTASSILDNSMADDSQSSVPLLITTASSPVTVCLRTPAVNWSDHVSCHSDTNLTGYPLLSFELSTVAFPCLAPNFSLSLPPPSLFNIIVYQFNSRYESDTDANQHCEETESLDVKTPLKQEQDCTFPLGDTAQGSVQENSTPLKIKEEAETLNAASTNATCCSGEVPRRRIASREEVQIPLKHGWRREVRIKKGSSRWQGETWYYAPCGKRMKQFPEVIKYLIRNQVQDVSRELFSFSPRMPVGDFYEERDTPEGMQWFKLTSEEIPSRIIAITGKRGRPRNSEKGKVKAAPRVKRGRGRPPKVKMVELLSKDDARLMKKLEAQDVLSDEDKLKLSEIKKKMRRKVQRQHCCFFLGGEARNKRKQEAKNAKKKEEKKKAKLHPRVVETLKIEFCIGVMKIEALKAKEKEKEKVKAARKAVDKKLLAQRRLEERRRQQTILEELKKPTEDMCLTDHQPLPEFARIPGLVLPGRAFSNCLTIVEFLHSYGKVLGFDVSRGVPNLCTLQEGLLNVGDSLGEVQDLLVRLLQAALRDPGLPSHYQSVKVLGEKVSEIGLNRDNVSEALRIFLEAYGVEMEFCESLRTKPFHAHPPEKKAVILAFLVNELNGSTIVTQEIDKTLDNMANYRKNKWIIEGKLRSRLKIALAKKTGQPEPVITTMEEGQRRRSARIVEEEEEEEEEGKGKKSRKEVEGESLSTASIPEIERQIDKLTKRQLFFRKKLLHASQTLRALSLGQDRYKRRYWVLPHLGGIFVEGSEGVPAAEDFMKEREESMKILVSKISPVKSEPKGVVGSPDLTATPGRSRGRPRKIKLEPGVAGAAKQRRRGKSKLANGLLEDWHAAGRSQLEHSQSAMLSWLTQSQTSLLNSSALSSPGTLNSTGASSAAREGSANLDNVKENAEKRGQWFNLLPRTPCDAASVTRPSVASDQSPPKKTEALLVLNSPNFNPAKSSAVTSLQHSRTPKGQASPVATPGVHLLGFTLPGQPKRRGRPPTKFFKHIEQKYFTQLIALPVPEAIEMQKGWWWIKDPKQLNDVLKVLHPRGIREKALHKHLTKHLEYLKEVCIRPKNDPIFEFSQEEDSPISTQTLETWSVIERTREVDLAILQWVEELEQRVLAADLQLRGWTCPDPDSTREDLDYLEHKLDPMEDGTMKSKKDSTYIPRIGTNPLDLAVMRLAALESNIEKRYLKEPLWNLSEVVVEKVLTQTFQAAENGLSETKEEYEITPRIRTWRQTIERCRNSAQVSLCIQQLEKSIAWEKSVNKVTCLVCRKGDNDEYLLLCDQCDRGCHMYCHRPKITEVPDGDWFCPVCISRVSTVAFGNLNCGGGRGEIKVCCSTLPFANGVSPRKRRCLKRSKKRRRGRPSWRDGLSPAKRRRLTTKNHTSDLTFCEIILMEMEAHDDAWPFLEPVNPRLVPGYRKIIKHPMDFSAMRERLLSRGYSSCEEFASDAMLIFDNCQTFNEDDSEVGKAGHAMRKFFESRWAEFYQGKSVSL
uniref:Bromodomain adjacent to zinc finger domain 2A n=1 Tax=Latimeria chalumnae TaxID=7897 RepID=H3BH80_LATCH